jgi:hypothetical protein
MTDENTENQQEQKLWAGKYQTPEEMEAAIAAKDKEYSKLYNEHQTIKNETQIPASYRNPDGLDLDANDTKEIQALAQEAGLTQAQYERTAKAMASKYKAIESEFENSKQEIGEEKLTILQDYVKKFYPESLHNTVLTKIIKDKQAMNDALKDREARLNSQAPGMSSGGGGQAPKYDGQAECLEAAKAYHKNPTQANRQKYINVCNEVGAERFKDKVRG